MKKVLLFLGLLIASDVVFGGGIVTNTNQSTAWTRMLVRDASTDIDAAFSNPAGLTKLPDGLHLSLSNQTIIQEMSIKNSTLGKTFNGDVFAPVFPDFYAVYKKNKLAFSLGFMPIGGGGSASYPKGVPMIESKVNDVVTRIGNSVSGYSLDASFDGSSVYFGLQGGVSYAINDMISVYGGARYVWIKNTYNGEMNNVVFKTPLGNIPASTFMTQAAQSAPPALKGMMLAGAQIFGGQNLETKQTGTGITPIVGVNLSFMEDKLNIGVKYEFKTEIEIENKTPQGKGFVVGFTEGANPQPIEMFPDGQKTDADIPALLSIGAQYKVTEKLSTQVGFHSYFDKKLDWAKQMQADGTETNIIDKNLWELGVGFEYQLNEKLLLSTGYLRGQTGVADTYHNDTRFSLVSNTFGLGGAYKINDMIRLQAGTYYVEYNDKTVTDTTYDKYNLGFSIGIDFTFGNL